MSGLFRLLRNMNPGALTNRPTFAPSFISVVKPLHSTFLRGYATTTDPEGMGALYEEFMRDPEGVSKWPVEKVKSYLEPISRDIEPSIGERERRKKQVEKVTSVSAIQKTVKQAILDHTLVRVVGSRHSPTSAIYADVDHGINIELSGEQLREFKILKEGLDEKGKFARVRVGAGCHLGKDPKDRESKLENSLDYQLTQAKYSLPIVGGITHQSVAGFMQTGSSGGSTTYGFSDCIESFKFINGRGEEVNAERGTDIFNAVGISMGLMGIITEVTLNVREVYAVEGTEEVMLEESSWLTKTAQGKYPFEDVIKSTEYAHVDWFPQKGVHKVIQWSGKRVPHILGDSKPYENVLSEWWASGGAAAVFSIMDKIRRKPVITKRDLEYVAFLINIFVKGDTQKFKSIWYQALATEDQVAVDGLINTLFTEIWFPLEKTTEVIDILKSLYENPRIALGNYGMEMYSAHESPFWLSPAYGRNVMRIDPLWWAYNQGNPAEFFKNFWDKMLGIHGARLHWGKYIPENGQCCGDTTFNLDYLRKCYPKIDEWLRIREEMDPHQIFLTDYWRNRFEITPSPRQELRLS